ncbi:unnamed protein product [Closterium sp. NIES-64]|nr:unnamed protein product [Closterium sp. NIES-64]CAI5993792.1 unnamed protein product [Closterium sp. NIES-65]
MASLVTVTAVSSVKLSSSQFMASHKPSVEAGRSKGRVFQVRVRASDDENKPVVGPDVAAVAAKTGSILCTDCEGNGAVQCKQCQGGGVNLEDHFQGRFKKGTSCWLCRVADCLF